MSGKDKKPQKSKKSSSIGELEKPTSGLILLCKAIEVVEYREKREEFWKEAHGNKLESSWKSDQMTFV
jgi:hypothetical protein